MEEEKTVNMGALYNSPWGKTYVNNKYIYEHASDPNAPEAKAAATENAKIRDKLGLGLDTMSYETLRTQLAGYSPYFERAEAVQVQPEYKQESDRLYDAIHHFTYHAEEDPAYLAYSDALEREGRSVQKSNYAQNTASTGGRNNSWAAAAAAQVGQAYAQKKSELAASLAQQAYNRLIEQYGIAQDRYRQAADAAERTWTKNMQMGQNQVAMQKEQLDEARENERFDWEKKNFQQAYTMRDEQNKIQQKLLENELIRDELLTEKNRNEFERWKADPYYQIKDEALVKAIAKASAYTWLRENTPEYLYSKFY